VTCDDATNLIVARIDGEIAAEDRAVLDGHLAQCAACRAVGAELSGQHDDLRRAFAPRREAAAAAVAERVIGRLDLTVSNPAASRGAETAGDASASAAASAAGAAARRDRSWWAGVARTVAAAAAGFALAVVLMRPWERSVPSVSVPTTNTAQVAASSTTTTSKPVAPAERPVGQLALATGAVFVCPSGSDDWRPLESGGVVPAGIKVRTGPSVRCEFKMVDGSEVRLNAQTEVTLASARRVEVAGGQVFSSVRRQPEGEQFVVRAGPADATLTALGTSFDVSCSPRQTTLTVVEGSVKLEAAGGAADVVKGGEAITLDDGGRFGEKRQVESLMRATQWVDEILVLKGRDNPELAKRIDDIFAQLGHEKMWHLNAQEVRRLGDHCVVPLTRYIQSERSRGGSVDEMKRREAARIVCDVATTWAIPELINLLSDADGDVRYNAAKALQRLTGQSHGLRPEQWRDQGLMSCMPTVETWHGWWERNKTRFPGADPAAVRPLGEVRKGGVESKAKGG
jgi:anti-sigma factor RsiW